MSSLRNISSLEDSNGECIRLQLLRISFEKALNNLDKEFRLEDFQEQLREVVSKGEAKKLYSTFIGEIKKNATSLLSNIIEEENVNSKFDILTRITEEGLNDKPVWRPSGNSREDLRAHIMAQKLRLKEQLESELKQEEELVCKLKREISSKRKKLSRSRKKYLALSKTHTDASSSLETLKKQQIECKEKLEFNVNN